MSMVNVGKYTTPMDPMGFEISKLTQLRLFWPLKFFKKTEVQQGFETPVTKRVKKHTGLGKLGFFWGWGWKIRYKKGWDPKNNSF